MDKPVYIACARDQLGIASYLSIIEESYDDGSNELIITPTYNKNDAYKFLTSEEAYAAVHRGWLLANLTWAIEEIEGN